MNNEGYMLIFENDNTRWELDWTKTKKFSYLNEVKYKLHFIDMFTKHFKNKDELLNFLYESKILKKHFDNIEIKIVHFEKANDDYLYEEDSLINELLFQDTDDLLYKTDILLSTFKDFIQERDFGRMLHKYYIENEKNNLVTINKYQSQLEYLETTLQDNFSNEIKLEYDLIKRKLVETNRIYKLIETLATYNTIINEGIQLDNSDYIAFNDAIYKFVIGQKYHISIADEFNTLTIDKNEDGNNKINYPELHKLVALIQIYQNLKNNIAKKYIYTYF